MKCHTDEHKIMPIEVFLQRISSASRGLTGKVSTFGNRCEISTDDFLCPSVVFICDYLCKSFIRVNLATRII